MFDLTRSHVPARLFVMARRSDSHHLSLRLREPNHVHRWVAECTCGWYTIPLRNKKTALRSFQRHNEIRTRSVNSLNIMPRPVTPPERSPFGKAVAA